MTYDEDPFRRRPRKPTAVLRTIGEVCLYDDKIEHLSNHLEISPRHCHELITFIQHIGWQRGKFNDEELVTKLKEFFPQYEITGTPEPDEESEHSVEGTQKKKAYLIFKELKRIWEIPLHFFDSEETVSVLKVFHPVSLLEKTGWLFTYKNETSTGKGALELCQTIIKTGKSLMTIQRYKGLGEMNPEQLWETTMDPINRSFLQVTIEDVLKADQWFVSLMGDVVEDRREYIEKHAHFVKNLDV